jgi:very-short-patch-repair endonuclease
MTHLPYNKNLKEFSRRLRNDSTFTEVLLWNELKAGKMMGYKFNRQKPLLNYIVDFYCKKLNLVIEVDGVSHDNELVASRDRIREEELKTLGLVMLRFDDIEIRNNMSSVLRTIEGFINDFEMSGKSPRPPFQGGVDGSNGNNKL